MPELEIKTRDELIEILFNETKLNTFDIDEVIDVLVNKKLINLKE